MALHRIRETQALPQRDFKKGEHARRVAGDKARQVAEDKNGARGLGFGGIARGLGLRRRRARHGRSYDDYRVGATWEVASCNAGASAPEDCERALCEIVGRLQQHFDIAPT
jgi:hypothetical protein